MRWLEKQLVISDDPLPEVADAVIGIGTGLSVDEEHASPQSAAIANKCLELFQAGQVSNVVLSGGYTKGVIPLTEARAMCDIIAWQVPRENIYLEQKSTRTYGNANNTLLIALEEEWKAVIIVAQQWHARRVKATFRKRWASSDIEIYIVKAWSDYGGGTQRRLNYWFNFWIWDALAFVYSKLKGYC